MCNIPDVMRERKWLMDMFTNFDVPFKREETMMEVRTTKYPVPVSEHKYTVVIEDLTEKEHDLFYKIAGANMTIPQYISTTYPAHTRHEVARFLTKLATGLLV